MFTVHTSLTDVGLSSMDDVMEKSSWSSSFLGDTVDRGVVLMGMTETDLSSLACGLATISGTCTVWEDSTLSLSPSINSAGIETNLKPIWLTNLDCSSTGTRLTRDCDYSAPIGFVNCPSSFAGVDCS